MLAVAGLTFAYTSCTDYSEDIDKTNSRVDELNKELATVKEQADANKASIDALKEAQAKANEAISALQTAVSTLETKHDADVKTINNTIDGLKGDVTALTNRVKAIEEKLPSYATLDYVNATFATKEQMKQANEEIAKLGTRLTTAEGQIKTLNDKYDSDLKISEIVAKIAAAQTAADNAQKTATEALGKVNTLIDALGVYAEKGKLEAKIQALEAADADLTKETQRLDQVKLNIADFDKTFDAALAKACEEGGKVYEDIYKPLNAEIQKVSAAVTALENSLNAKISALWGVFNTELRSLVFVPSLYVDGIEAVEYTCGDFETYKFEEIKGAEFVDSSEVAGKFAVRAYKETHDGVRVNPAVAVEYEMNPSSAVVTADDVLTVLTRKAESVSTRSDAPEYEAEFVGLKNGNLVVNLKSNKTTFDDFRQAPDRNGRDTITVFALQATVRKGENEDTTVTSDYARIYESAFYVDAIAYNTTTLGHAANKCGYEQPTNHLYDDVKDALKETPELTVDYKGSLDIKKVLETHYYVASHTSKFTAEKDGVYETDYPENDYGLSYRFELVDYCYFDGKSDGSSILAKNVSESSFATIDPETGVLTPGVDGKVSAATIDRQPLVRVTLVTENGDIVAVGYIKVHILPKDYIKTDETKLSASADNCENATLTVADLSKVYAAVELTKEADFDKVYALQFSAGNAIQYSYANNKFAQVAADKALGTISEKISKDGVSSLEVVLTPAEKSAIYKMAGHTTTIWVRYVFVRNAKVNPVEDEFEGVYVPITITVTKNAAGTVGVKLSAYWFDNQSKAILNVKVPNAEPGQPVPATWSTPINQVWEGNAPRFTVNGKLAGGDYKYYFAPVQPKVGDVQLTVAESNIYDLVDGSKSQITDNSKISEAEVALSADYSKGIYTNTELKANGEVIATIDQATGVVTYANTDLAKKLLNYSPSVPKTDAKLYANIGVVLKNSAADCNLVSAIESEVNPYYFLRPLNLSAVAGKVYVDGVDAYKPQANLNVFDVFEFTDWRGETGRFVTPDFSNLWYFKYYGISNFKVDVDNVTTNLNGGDLAKTKLSEKTKNIVLYHCTGDIKNPTKVDSANGLDITYKSDVTPTWGQEQYDGLSKKFGYIRYENNGANVSESFMLRIPVKVTYTWGEIETTVDVTVTPTI